MSTETLIEETSDRRCRLTAELNRIAEDDDVQSLLSQLHECLAMTVGSIVKLAAIVRRLELLEVNVVELRIPNMAYFRKIAHGGMLPALFINLAGSPQVMRRVSRLPIPDQQKIVDGESMKVMLRGGDHLMISVTDMTGSQVTQVFAGDHIRSESQQVAWLVEHSQRAEVQKVPSPPVMLDRKRHGIVVGDVFVSASDLAAYLGDLAKK